MNRPTLIPGLPRVWRGPGELQIGSDPARALLLHLPDERCERVLDLLDGSRSEQVVLQGAAELGIPEPDCRALLDTLRTAGLTLPASSLVPPSFGATAQRRLTGEAAALALRGVPLPAQALRRRFAAHVVLAGRGRLAAPIAVALAQAGVGHVRPEVTGEVRPGDLPGGPLRAADIGRRRRDAINEVLSLLVPGTTQGVRRMAPSLRIQLDHDEPVAVLAHALAIRRQPHLAVTIREGSAVVGPLVDARGRPCLHCLDLHRRERDATWPGPVPAAAEPCAVSTLLATTAYAVAEALTFLDGGTPETAGATAEITAPGRVRRRSWLPHPECPCAR
ncbi:hypothetical protein ACQPZX_45075 [Actinoplanes sp. CA-142083]|uniref:hypothetical protein n=1 Tax=Actinoplanes sp. CA-142083 TaxID=3239903 RepID=UPI003D8B00C2